MTSIVEEDLDSISANIDYVQENIVELQNDLIAVDDAKSEGDTLEAHTIIASSSPKEAKYLLEHLLDLVLNLVSGNLGISRAGTFSLRHLRALKLLKRKQKLKYWK